MASASVKAGGAALAAILLVGAAPAGAAGAAPAPGTVAARTTVAAVAPQAARPKNPALRPGRAGALVMGRTTVHQARKRGYIRWNPVCEAFTGNWLSSPPQRHYGTPALTRGKVVVWYPYGAGRTTKGLRTRSSLARGKALYPKMRKTATVRNDYGTVFKVYSVKGRHGWLDWFRSPGGRFNHFAVRALSVGKPIPVLIDGC